MNIPDARRPDVKLFWSSVDRVAGCWIWSGGENITLDGYRGARRVARYLLQGEFIGQVEKNSDCAAGCCRPEHQRFVEYRPVEVRHPRRERDKKIRLLRAGGWRPRDIADEVGVSRRVIARVLKDD